MEMSAQRRKSVRFGNRDTSNADGIFDKSFDKLRAETRELVLHGPAVWCVALETGQSIDNASHDSSEKRLGFVDPAVGVSILHKIKRADDPERFDSLAEELARDSSAWELAALYEAQTVLDPRDTRTYLINMLDIHRGSGVGKHRLANWPTSF